MQYTQALALKANNNCVKPEDIKAMLVGLKGVTMAGLTAVTEVKTAAAHRGVNIMKVSEASVQLFNDVNDPDVYGKAVRRSAARDARNDPRDVENQETQETWYAHDADCHSIVRHRTTGEPYLYALFNSGRSVYLINGLVADKHEVAKYLTPSEARKIQEPQSTFNITDNIHHDVTVRVLKMASIVELRAMKQALTV
jgi:hypothetical protein